MVRKLQALVYDILPSTTAVFSYAIGSRKLSANEQFFVGTQTVVSLLQTTQNKQTNNIYIILIRNSRQALHDVYRECCFCQLSPGIEQIATFALKNKNIKKKKTKEEQQGNNKKPQSDVRQKAVTLET